MEDADKRREVLPLPRDDAGARVVQRRNGTDETVPPPGLFVDDRMLSTEQGGLRRRLARVMQLEMSQRENEPLRSRQKVLIFGSGSRR